MKSACIVKRLKKLFYEESKNEAKFEKHTSFLIGQESALRLKHMEIKQLVQQTWADCRRIALTKVAGTKNVADILRKALSIVMFESCRDWLCLRGTEFTLPVEQ